jgi:hypothetical protein
MHPSAAERRNHTIRFAAHALRGAGTAPTEKIQKGKRELTE